MALAQGLWPLNSSIFFIVWTLTVNAQMCLWLYNVLIDCFCIAVCTLYSRTGAFASLCCILTWTGARFDHNIKPFHCSNLSLVSQCQFKLWVQFDFTTLLSLDPLQWLTVHRPDRSSLTGRTVRGTTVQSACLWRTQVTRGTSSVSDSDTSSSLVFSTFESI